MRINDDYTKVQKVIKSCKTLDQLKGARRMYAHWHKTHSEKINEIRSEARRLMEVTSIYMLDRNIECLISEQRDKITGNSLIEQDKYPVPAAPQMSRDNGPTRLHNDDFVDTAIVTSSLMDSGSND